MSKFEFHSLFAGVDFAGFTMAVSFTLIFIFSLPMLKRSKRIKEIIYIMVCMGSRRSCLFKLRGFKILLAARKLMAAVGYCRPKKV